MKFQVTLWRHGEVIKYQITLNQSLIECLCETYLFHRCFRYSQKYMYNWSYPRHRHKLLHSYMDEKYTHRYLSNRMYILKISRLIRKLFSLVQLPPSFSVDINKQKFNNNNSKNYISQLFKIVINLILWGSLIARMTVYFSQVPV